MGNDEASEKTADDLIRALMSQYEEPDQAFALLRNKFAKGRMSWEPSEELKLYFHRQKVGGKKLTIEQLKESLDSCSVDV